MENIRKKIEQIKPERDRLIGEYLLNCDNIKDITAKEVSNSCYCSPSTITRFSKKVGAKNFYELKFLLSKEEELKVNKSAENYHFVDKINKNIIDKNIVEILHNKKVFIVTDQEINNEFYFATSFTVITLEEYTKLNQELRMNSCVLFYGNVTEKLEQLLMDQLSYIFIFSYNKDIENYDSWLNVSFIKLSPYYFTRNFEFLCYINMIYYKITVK